MIKVTLKKEDVVLGEPIPWNIYSSQGSVLLKKGLRIHSEEKLDQLLQCGLSRDPDTNIDPLPIHESDNSPQQSQKPGTSDLQSPQEEHAPENKHPFDSVNRFTQCLDATFEDHLKGRPGAHEQARKLAEDIHTLVTSHPDICLGAVHMYYPQAYSLMQPVYSAVMCALTGNVLNYSKDSITSLCAAALTANLGMFRYQDKLNSQTTPLDEKQWEHIKQHPRQSVRLLTDSGLEDDDWLSMVLHHHVRDDGSGYPGGISRSKLHPGAKIINLADSYLAMISKRPYSRAIHPNAALKEIYRLTSQDDQTSLLAFIKTLGVYPPGTFVQLENGEIAVVTAHSGRNSLKCKVVSVCSESMKIFPMPIHRDTADPKFAIQRIVELKQELELDIRSLFRVPCTA